METTINVRNNRISFNDVRVFSLNDLERQIEEKHQTIESIKSELYMIGMAHPKDLVSDRDVIGKIKSLVDEKIDIILDESITLQNLYIIKALVEKYKYIDNMSDEEAWKAAVVDDYAELRNSLSKDNDSTDK